MPDYDTSDERELLSRLAAGDEAAFRSVYDRYRKKVASFAYLLTESQDITDDILQETFVKLWLNRSRLGEVREFNAWLHMITRNLVADAMKRLARERKLRRVWADRTTEADNYADEIIFARENERLLQQAVGQLSPQQQKVYRLSREQGLRNEEIAEQLGISPMTAKNHLVNAMREIRDYFRSHPQFILLVAFMH